MTGFERFQQAQRTLELNPKDEAAQYVADLWNAGKNLAAKNTALAAEITTLKADLDKAKRDAAAEYHRYALLESKLLVCPTKPRINTVQALLDSFSAESADYLQ